MHWLADIGHSHRREPGDIRSHAKRRSRVACPRISAGAPPPARQPRRSQVPLRDSFQSGNAADKKPIVRTFIPRNLAAHSIKPSPGSDSGVLSLRTATWIRQPVDHPGREQRIKTQSLCPRRAKTFASSRRRTNVLEKSMNSLLPIHPEKNPYPKDNYE